MSKETTAREVEEQALTNDAGSRVARKGTSELLTEAEVAEFCACSRRHIRRLHDRGAMPRCCRLGALVRWRRTEILNWIEMGCPDCRKAKAGRP